MLVGEGVTRPVAVKLIREDFAQRPAFRAALAQEARFAALLSHPNIVHVLDFDEDDRGHMLLIMEYIDGVDLLQLAAGRAVPPPVAIYLAAEVLRGLGYAHALPDGAGPIRGIVHRDVSPQNILVDRHGAVKVADFGVAKAISTSGIVSGLKGKAAYMSPEQAASKPHPHPRTAPPRQPRRPPPRPTRLRLPDPPRLHPLPHLRSGCPQ